MATQIVPCGPEVCFKWASFGIVLVVLLFYRQTYAHCTTILVMPASLAVPMQMSLNNHGHTNNLGGAYSNKLGCADANELEHHTCANELGVTYPKKLGRADANVDTPKLGKPKTRVHGEENKGASQVCFGTAMQHGQDPFARVKQRFYIAIPFGNKNLAVQLRLSRP